MKHEQREMLFTCMNLYLNRQWTMVAPSPERNSTIRVLQVLKGRLLPLLEPSKAAVSLRFTVEEMAVVTQMLREFTSIPGIASELASPQKRTELLTLKMQIERNGGI